MAALTTDGIALSSDDTSIDCYGILHGWHLRASDAGTASDSGITALSVALRIEELCAAVVSRGGIAVRKDCLLCFALFSVACVFSGSYEVQYGTGSALNMSSHLLIAQSVLSDRQVLNSLNCGSLSLPATDYLVPWRGRKTS